MFNVENACASSSTAFHLAWLAIASGQSETALVVGVEKLSHEDKAVSFGAFAGAVDIEEPKPEGVGKGGGSIFMDMYAAKARKWMSACNADASDFARVVVKSRKAASLNPHAQLRKETTVEAVIRSRRISDQLTFLICSSFVESVALFSVCLRAYTKK